MIHPLAQEIIHTLLQSRCMQMTRVWIDNRKVKGHLCCPDTIKGERQVGNEITKMQESGDKSGAATCGVKNKLWVIIASKGKSLASDPGHDQCF